MTTTVAQPSRRTVYTRPASSLAARLAVDCVGSLALGLAAWHAIDNVNPPELKRAIVSVVFGLTAAVLGIMLSRWQWHGNTQVSMTEFGQGNIGLLELSARFGAQLLGFLLACLTIWPPFTGQFLQIGEAVPHRAPSVSLVAGFWYAAMMSFIFCLGVVVANLISGGRGPMKSMLIGLDLGLCIYWGWHIEGGGINIARNLAPMILSGDWAPAETLGELVGAMPFVLIGLVMLVFRRRRRTQTVQTVQTTQTTSVV